MLAWFSFALRNLQRNRRRSLYTILAIALGFAAVNTFGGFTQYVFNNLRDAHIYVYAQGQLTLFPRQDAAADAPKPIFSAEQLGRLEALLQEEPEVRVISPVLEMHGMISNGELSTMFVGQGVLAEREARFQAAAQGMLARLHTFEGAPLRDDRPGEIGIPRGLMRVLGIEMGEGAILVSPTLGGQINALDVEVVQRVFPPSDMLERSLVSATLPLAQSLYDTDGVSRVNLLLAPSASPERLRERLETRLQGTDLEVRIRTWRELSPFTVKVERMFQVIFLFIFGVVAVIVVMSVVNTVSMAVLERTREVGTMRALGMHPWGVVRLFALETGLLGLFGCALGLILLALVIGGVNYSGLTWVPPQLSAPVPLEVYWAPAYQAATFLALLAVSVLAAVLPARRAAQANIVESLGHV
jgi:putative ABC transport system permease protein